MIDELRQLLRERPNARVLVLEALPDDVDATIGLCVGAGLRAGTESSEQVLVYTPKGFQRKKRSLWPIDVVFVHNQHNMHRTDRTSSYKPACQSVNAQRHEITWRVFEPAPVLELQDILVRGWTCGASPVHMNCRELAIAIPFSDEAYCGSVNPDHTMFCQHCGRFRGIEYH